MNKRRLYENIMRNVSKTVKRALQENAAPDGMYHPTTREELADNIIECLENGTDLNFIDVSEIDDFEDFFHYYSDDYNVPYSNVGKYIEKNNIRELDISEWDINPDAYVDYMFYGSTLREVILPNTLRKIGYSMFGNSDIIDITIPNSITSIGDYAFRGCSHLRNIIIPNSVTSIGDYAFNGCRDLTSVTIPNSVEKIGNRAFYWCPNLTIYVDDVDVERFKRRFDIVSNKTKQIKPIRECRNIRYRR